MAKIINCSNHPAEPELLTLKEVAALMRVEIRTVQRWVARGLLKPRRIGRTLRFSHQQVMEQLMDQASQFREVRRSGRDQSHS